MSSHPIHPNDDWVAAAQSGDRDAFRQLVEQNQRDVYTLAVRLVRDPHLAEDVAQETFVRAWRALPAFRGEAAFSTWLHRITVNTAWTHRRRQKRHRHADIDEVQAVVDETRRHNPGHLDDTLHLSVALREALNTLPAEQRMVVVLKDVESWSHLEIAEALGITVGAAKVRLHRARRRLRALLADVDW